MSARQLVEETDRVVEETMPTRVNINQAFLEILDAYIRARKLIQAHEVPSCDVYLSKRVYELAEKAGLIKVLHDRFPEVRLRKAPTFAGIQGQRVQHVIYDEAQDFPS